MYSSERNCTCSIGYTGARWSVQSVTRKGTRKPSGKGVVDLEDCRAFAHKFRSPLIHGDIMNIIQDKKKLRIRITAVAKRAGTIQDDIQEVLVSSGFHYRHTHDNSLLTYCVVAMPEGVRKERMTGWVTEMFQCKWDNEKSRFKKAKVSTFLTEAFDVEKYAENKWYDFEVDSSPNIWQLMRKVKALTRDIEKHEGDAKKQAIGALDAVNELTNTLHKIGCAEVSKVA